MFTLKNLSVPLALLIGALGGYLAASGRLASMYPAKATAQAAPARDGACGGEGARHFAAYQDDKKGGKKPNILVIFGDDIGIPQISAYTQGLMGYRTPNIDRIAKEGAYFTDSYCQNSCTAGRASFILGQEPFRTGLLTIGMPGDPHGIPE